MLYFVLISLFAALFSKEYLLVNDNLIIILVFGVIFVYLISAASPIVEGHINDVRYNMINDFATNIRGNVSIQKNHFQTLKLYLEYLYFFNIFAEAQYDALLNNLKVNI